MTDPLAELRAQIDDVDAQIVDLLAQRLDLVTQVGEVKGRVGLPIYAPDREREMIDAKRAMARERDVPPDLVEDVLRRCMREAYAHEKNMGFTCQAPDLGPVVVVGGGGRMGSLFGRLLTLSGYDVRVVEREDTSEQVAAAVRDAGLVVVSVPIHETVAVLRSLPPLPEDCLLVDLTSTKREAVANAELDVQQQKHDLERLEEECRGTRSAIAALEAEHAWIAAEHGAFGEPGSMYDFSKHSMSEVRRMCRRLEEQQSGMKKKVNPKVMNMIDNVEKKEAALQQMLGTVLKDKNKIEQTIDELDRYKKDALQATFEHVDRDFGEIFSELLPGNYACLQPPDGADITQGLEVKVRLGAVWKQSLTELSGGQRSLIALSLIMSLLQFKPAPMYILDEIDAALDLSHTQHIGHLFRTRFRGSQFIVVSLKEGLFTNANVLFRARFRDGTSIVERITQKSAAADKENARMARPAASDKPAAPLSSHSIHA